MPPPPERATDAARRAGLGAAVAAYVWWGCSAVYFRALSGVPALEILCHRVLWSVVLLLPLVAWSGRWGELRGALRPGRVLWMLAGSSALIAVNWLTFIWAVAHARLLDASLGYFISPLVNVLLGVAVLGERLRPAQAAAVAVAAGAVAVQWAGLGRWPWIAMVLAASFGLYGLARKTAKVGSLVGLAAETTLLLPAAAAWLVWVEVAGRGAFLGGSGAEPVLLALAGVVTATPLVWFAFAARRLSLTTMGLLQYLSPTLHFLVATLAFREEISAARLASFGLIWVALGVYTHDALRAAGEARRRESGG